MTRVLILFTKASVQNGAAYPERLQSLITTAALEITVDVADYNEVVFELATGQASVRIPRLNMDIAAYDVVYLRRIEENASEAVAVGKYCLAKGVTVADEEIASRPGSSTKLTQYIQFALKNIPIPHTIYSPNGNLLLKAMQNADTKVEFPLILKAINGSRGADNHLVYTIEEMKEIISSNSDVPFLVQQYIPNTSDYRVWVCGGELGPILLRSRNTGHKNNTSQGGEATLLEDKGELPAAVLEQCVYAANLLRRTIAGVDVVFENDDTHGPYYILEVNRAPQVEGTPFEDLKARALAEYFLRNGKDRSI